MGHVRNYNNWDVVVIQILNGFDVLHPMGWMLLGGRRKTLQNE